jgi:hypothetical protein
VFTSREKTRLIRAIWCIAEVEGVRNGTALELAAGTSHVRWIMDRRRPAPAMQQPEKASYYVELHYHRCTSDQRPWPASPTTEQARNRRQAEGRQKGHGYTVILENPSDTDLHKREVRPC